MQRLIVFESEPYWQPELQRQFSGESVAVCACRSIADLQTRLSSAVFDGVVLDLAADFSGCLRWLGRRVAVRGDVPVIAVARAQHQQWEWHLRELGATAIVDEFIGGRRMAAVCRRAFHQQHTDCLRPLSQV